MTRKQELLAAYDDAWGYECESIEFALKGITEAEATYQDPIYYDDPVDEGYPLRGTILWQLAHLAGCYQEYQAMIVGRPADPPELALASPRTFTEARSALGLHRNQLRDTLAAIPEEKLEDLLCNGHSIAEHIRMSIRHDAWHMAQVVMVRRLFRKRRR